MCRRNSRNLITTLALSLLVLSSLGSVALAQDEGWEFGAGLYGWLPSIDGTLNKEIPGLGQSVEIDAGTLLENLSFTLQGTVVAQRKNWGIFADVIYLKETKSDNATLPIEEGVNAAADYSLNNWITNFGGKYLVAKTPSGTTFNTVFGVRYFYAKSTLNLRVDDPENTNIYLESTSNIWNGIIGGSGRFALGKNWYIPYHLDAGLGDSDFTWQGLLGANYEWHWGGLELSYRYLSFDQGQGSELQTMSMGGPELGIYFDF